MPIERVFTLMALSAITAFLAGWILALRKPNTKPDPDLVSVELLIEFETKCTAFGKFGMNPAPWTCHKTRQYLNRELQRMEAHGPKTKPECV